tara:strand:- start:1979 stop:2512 length:534 start_codon:yes stop_codon:yes gene_type:complete
MKIYTEVNYEWKDGELVKTSSDSFEYSGDIAFCGGGGGGGLAKAVGKATETVGDVGKGAGNFVADAGKGATMDVTGALDDTVAGTMDIIKDPAGTIKGGPGGSLGDLTDKIYGGTTKDLISGAQGKTEEESVAAPTLAAEEVDAQGALTAQNQKRKQSQGRGAANLTAGQSATMLTS